MAAAPVPSPGSVSLATTERDPASSRVGGAILLVALGVLLVAAIVLVTRSGGGGGQGVISGGSAAGVTGSSPFRVAARSGLSAGPAGAGAQGVAEIVSDGSQRAVVVAGRGLAATAGLARSGLPR